MDEVTKGTTLTVSIIIPAFNIEEYIAPCLDSVLAQTHRDIEVIVINDGSTDSTLSRCREFRDDRLVIVDQENSGVSAARNHGVAVANGEYIMFVDGDDLIAPSLVEHLLAAIETEHVKADAAVSTFAVFSNGLPGFQSAHSVRVVSGKEAVEELLYQRIENGPVGKLFRADVLGTSPFEPGIRVGEDLLMNLGAFEKCQRVAVSDAALYVYRIRPGSAMQGAREEDRIVLIEKLQALPFRQVALSSRVFAECLYVIFENVRPSKQATALLKRNRNSVIANSSVQPPLRIYALASWAGLWLPRLLHRMRNRNV